MKRVVIVQEGEWGSSSTQKGDYDAWIGTIKRVIEEAEEENYHTGKKEKVAEVKLVETLNDALERVKRGGVDTLVFISRGMLSQARKIKSEHRRLKVVLFTGLIPDDEVILVDKGWAPSSKLIRKIIL